MMNTTIATPKIIALSGPTNYGKTSVIKYVYELLNDQCTRQTKNCIAGNQGDDICKILTIRGIIIGIKSRGDPSCNLADCLRVFVQNECKLILCATRTSGETVDAVRAYDGIPISDADQSNESQKDKLDKKIHIIEWHAPITLQNACVVRDGDNEICRANERVALNIFAEIKEFIYIQSLFIPMP